MAAPKKPRRLIQSIQRANDILDLFIRDNESLGITRIAERVALPKTTAQGLVQTLEALEFLEKDTQTLTYRLGPKVFRLGMQYAAGMDIVTIGKVWMERLSFQFREPVNVGMLVDDKVVVLLRVDPDNQFMSFPQAGSIIPLHTTCIGKILFAYMDEQKRRSILSDYRFDRFTPNTISSLEDFEAAVRTVRKEGISFENQESVPGMAGIGAPIFNHTNTVIAAFTITGDADNIHRQRDKIIDAVRYTSTELSRSLGYRP